ncbi:MAG TPA: class I SAM-dependent methyltransferase [Bryobacteraceae bacterium]|nr:class I SAM-dependent methyltransferase [Bryobacteraceae bacterium]
MNRAERSYYHQRAPEYDDWYLGAGQYAERVRPGWHAELGSLRATLAGLPACRTLDVACGTGFLTRDLAGEVIALDQSAAMLRIARERLPGAGLVQGDAFSLPFRDASFARLVAAHFYGHLEAPARARFWAETRRVASSLLVVDAAWREDVQPEEWQPRILRDGSRHTVYKRYFTPAQLAAEVGGGRILHSGRWFVAVLG